MKKLFLIAMVIIVIGGLILSGCAEPAPAPTPTPPPTPAPPPTPPPTETIELNLAYHHPVKAWPTPGAFEPWAKKIEEESDGRVKITVYPGATLVQMYDEINAVESGLADMVNFVPYITAGRFPLSEIMMLPKLFPSGAVAGRAYHELLNKYAVDTELKSVKLLWVLPLPPMQLHATKQVHTLEDMKGMKLRSEGKVETWTTEALGATGVVMATPELFSAVERGVVDGFFFLWEGVLAFGLKDITQYRAKVDMYTRGFPTVMNLETWNSLPPDIQEIFERNSGVEMSAKTGEGFDKANAGAMGAVSGYDKKVGNEGIYIFPEEENARWHAAVKPVWDKWLDEVNGKGLPGTQMLEDALSLIEKYSK